MLKSNYNIRELSSPKILAYARDICGIKSPSLDSEIFEEYVRLGKRFNLIVITDMISDDQVNKNFSIIKTSRISMPIIGNLYQAIVWSFATSVSRQKYDYVYIRLIHPSQLAAGLVAKIFFKKKLVILISDLHTRFVRGREKIIMLLFRRALSLADLIISYSPCIITEIESYYGKIDPVKVVIIKSAVDTSRFKPSITQKENTILCVARITPIKGIEDIINALPCVLKSIPDVRLKVVGPTTSKSYLLSLEELASKLEVKKSVEFVGPVQHDQIIQYFNSAKIILLISKSEAIPKSIIEAMSCGKPVIVSSVGGLPDLIEDGVNGVLLDNNNPIILAEKIIGLLNNESYRAEMGKAARKTVEENHEWDSFIEKLTNQLIRI